MSLNKLLEAMDAATIRKPTVDEIRKEKIAHWRAHLDLSHPQYDIYSQPRMRSTIEMFIKMYLNEELDGTATTHARHGIIIEEPTIETIMPETLVDSPPVWQLHHQSTCSPPARRHSRHHVRYRPSS